MRTRTRDAPCGRARGEAQRLLRGAARVRVHGEGAPCGEQRSAGAARGRGALRGSAGRNDGGLARTLSGARGSSYGALASARSRVDVSAPVCVSSRNGFRLADTETER